MGAGSLEALRLPALVLVHCHLAQALLNDVPCTHVTYQPYQFLLSRADLANLPLHLTTAQVSCTSTDKPISALSHAMAVLRRVVPLTGHVMQIQQSVRRTAAFGMKIPRN